MINIKLVAQIVVLVCAVLMGIGCQVEGTSSASSSSSVSDKTTERLLWESYNLQHYSFTLTLGCWNCDERFRYRVQHNGSDISFLALPNSNYADVNEYNLNILPRDIGQLFDFLDGKLESGSHFRRIIHDEDFGFPSYIFFDDLLGQPTIYEITEFETEDRGLNDLYSALALWHSKNIENYRYSQTLSCNCINNGDISVRVGSGKVLEAYSFGQDKKLKTEEIRELALSVEELFALVYRAYYEEVLYQVEYDETYGFPVSIILKNGEEGAYVEVSIYLNNFLLDAS